MTKTKLKITGLILALMMLITTLGVFGISAFAAEGDGNTLSIGDNAIEQDITYTYTAEKDGTLYITVTKLYDNEDYYYNSEELNYGYCAIELNGTAINTVTNTVAVETGDEITVVLKSLSNYTFYGTIELSWEPFVPAQITGVALTVDGVTYTGAEGEGYAFINPNSDITVSITGVNLNKMTVENVVYGQILWIDGTANWVINEDGTAASVASPASEWVYEYDRLWYENSRSEYYQTTIKVVGLSSAGTDLTTIYFNNVNAWETITATFYTDKDYYDNEYQLGTAELSLVCGESMIYATGNIPSNAAFVTFSNGTTTTGKIAISMASTQNNCYNNGTWEHFHTPEADDGNCLTEQKCALCGETAVAAKESHTTELAENKATCQQGNICDTCGTEYGETNPDNHDVTVYFDDKGFCRACDAYEPATLVTAENYESLGLTSDFVGYYAIGNAGQLFWFSETVNSGDNAINAVLTADIDMDIRDGWNPIGVQNEAVSPNVKIPYAGTFDGQNHIISNLYVYVGDGREAGLFGRVSGGTLKNFGVVNATVISDSVEGNGYRAGIIAGEIHNSTVENVFSAGRLSIITSHQQKGGIAGECADSILKNCFTTYGCLTDSTAALPTTVENCYYMASATNDDSCGENKLQAAFEYGELAYLLGSAYGMGAKGYPVLGATTVTESEGFVFVGQSLNLGGDLSMKYYVAAYGEGVSADTLKMQFVHNGVITTVTGVIDENGYYVFTFEGINPQCMGDAIDATLFLNGRVKAIKNGYTVEQNLLNLLEKYPDDEALKALVNDILAYGNAAGAYKQHETMINKDYVGSDRVIPDVTVAPSDYFTGYTVVFGQMNFIKIKVTLAEGNTLYLGETNITSAVVDGVYTTAGIAATDFDKVFIFTVKNGDEVVTTFAVSVNDYISAKKNDASIGNLVKALYNYGVSAEVYSHALTGEGEHYIDELGDCLCGYQATKINLSALSETYVINDSDYYFFTGTGSYGIKVESGNPTIVLNNVNIAVSSGSAIDIPSGSTTIIQVLGDNTISTTKTESWDEPCGGIFVTEGGTVNITSNGTNNILRAHGTLAAAIGGKYVYNGESYNAGNINISNVTVYAYANNYYAAAIGAAGEGTCGTINITNAVVYAYGAGDQWTSAPGIGSAWSILDWPDTIPVVIISDSEVHTFRYNPYSDYIGFLGDESGDTYATGSINCGDGGSVKNSTIYCYTVYGDTTDKVVTYDADGNATEN